MIYMNDLIGPCSDFLNKIVTVKVDRPMGSRHPRHGFIYPVNYGYIPLSRLKKLLIIPCIW